MWRARESRLDHAAGGLARNRALPPLREPDVGLRTCKGVTTTPLSARGFPGMHPPRLFMSECPPGAASSASRQPDQWPSDDDVIGSSLTDPGQFAVLFDRHASSVHRYLSRRVGNLADDLLSETFLIAFRRRASYRAVHVEVRPWLLGIATHLIQGQQRAEQRRLRALSRKG